MLRLPRWHSKEERKMLKTNSRKIRFTALFIALALVLSYLASPFSVLAAGVPQKNAHVNNDAVKNGSSINPIPVQSGDDITYDIVVDKTSGVEPIYDILFVLDWSSSMNTGYVSGTPTSPPSAANPSSRIMARDTIENLSQRIFEAYPGSRIAIMGLNSAGPDYDLVTVDPKYTYLQIDTDFVGPDQYASVLQHAFDTPPAFNGDDNSTFLRAAIDKLSGNTATQYGGGANPSTANPNPATVPAKKVLPRTNTTRTPMVIMISDFILDYRRDGYNNTAAYSQWAQFNSQVDRFKSTFSNGILITVRADNAHSKYLANFFFKSAPDLRDTEMQTAINKGNGDFGWVKFTYGQTQTVQDNLVFNMLQSKAPPPPEFKVIDQIPDGLTIQSTNPAATVSGQTVTWDLKGQPAGQYTLTVVTKVSGPPTSQSGNYENTALVQAECEADVNTNTTYHRPYSPPVNPTLHIRQIVITPISAVQKPLAGYFQLSNDNRIMPITGESGVHGQAATDYTEYQLTLSGTDNVYRVHDFIPQYYEFAGHYQNSGGAAANNHNTLSGLIQPSSVQNGQIQLDYSKAGEYWLTIYIKPANLPEDYTWSYASNDFGSISVTPPTPPKEYDFLFVFDWSSSMLMTTMVGTGRPVGLRPLDYARNIILSMGQDILKDYPGSRIAVMGLSSNDTNLNAPTRLNIMLDTDFLTDYTTFASKINASYTPMDHDDNAQFLKAAIDKMKGLNTQFGGNAGSGTTVPAVPVKRLIPRDQVNDRIPVIILLSDFQITQDLGSETVKNYWTTVLKGQATEYANSFSEGILLTARFDGLTNTTLPGTSSVKLNSSHYDDFMTNNVAPFNYASRNWGFLKIPYGTDYTTAETSFKSFITSHVKP
jgi:hypothetical protein